MNLHYEVYMKETIKSNIHSTLHPCHLATSIVHVGSKWPRVLGPWDIWVQLLRGLGEYASLSNLKTNPHQPPPHNPATARRRPGCLWVPRGHTAPLLERAGGAVGALAPVPQRPACDRRQGGERALSLATVMPGSAHPASVVKDKRTTLCPFIIIKG